MVHNNPVSEERFTMYILALSNGKYYAGITNNIPRRLIEHRTKKTGYCYRFQPLSMCYMRVFDTRTEARREEVKAKKITPKRYFYKYRFYR
jgi:predicted GIY-YIG superfamily endonuclease